MNGAADEQPAGHRVDDTVLDAASLAKLHALDPAGKTRLVARVLQAFDNSAKRFQPRLQAQPVDGDLNDLRLVVHTLKSSSGSIGALQLAALCVAVETMLREGRTEDLRAAVEAVSDELGRVLAAIRHLKNEHDD